MYRLIVKDLRRQFGQRRVFRDISFELSRGQSLAVTGHNGSGKTTLLRILAGLTAPSAGNVSYYHDDTRLDRSAVRKIVSYVGPELTLYDNLTGYENLIFFSHMRGTTITRDEMDRILDEIGLPGRGEDFYGAYSSGMKMRLKYAVAQLNDPVFLLLDEPTSNLDEAGKKVVRDIIDRQKSNGVLIVATNVKEEYGFAEKLYQLGG